VISATCGICGQAADRADADLLVGWRGLRGTEVTLRALVRTESLPVATCGARLRWFETKTRARAAQVDEEYVAHRNDRKTKRPARGRGDYGRRRTWRRGIFFPDAAARRWCRRKDCAADQSTRGRNAATDIIRQGSKTRPGSSGSDSTRSRTSPVLEGRVHRPEKCSGLQGFQGWRGHFGVSAGEIGRHRS